MKILLRGLRCRGLLGGALLLCSCCNLGALPINNLGLQLFAHALEKQRVCSGFRRLMSILHYLKVQLVLLQRMLKVGQLLALVINLAVLCDAGR